MASPNEEHLARKKWQRDQRMKKKKEEDKKKEQLAKSVITKPKTTLQKLTATGFTPGALASPKVKQATKKAAEPARQKAIQDAEKALANAKDRRSKAAASQKLRDAQLPLTGRDAKLGTAGRDKIQDAKELWHEADRLEKTIGRTSETQAMKRYAHNQAERVRIQHGYTGGTTGEDHESPLLSTEERKLTKVGQENLKQLKLWHDYGKRNHDGEMMQEAARQAEILRQGYTPYSDQAKVSWADLHLPDKDVLQDDIDKAWQSVKDAQMALRNYINTRQGMATFGTNDPTLQRLQDNLAKREEEMERAEKRLEQAEYLEKYGERTYTEDGGKFSDFWNQFRANWDASRIDIDANLAYNEYLKDPTSTNLAMAMALSDLGTNFQTRNGAVLDEEGQVLPWISDSLAGYGPQLIDQVGASAKGAAAAIPAGALAGSVVPGVGTLTGALWAGRGGIVAGSGKYSYDTMRGAAFRQLVEAGVDYETARQAAGDEAVISALIEMADTGIDIFTLGIGSALKMAGKGAAKTATKTAGKRLATALGKYGLNIGGEMGQEFLQQGVSYANLHRDDTGLWDLAKETWGVTKDAITGKNPEAWTEMSGAAKEGGKIAAMVGGTGMVTNAAINKGMEKAITSMDQTASDKELGKRVKEMGREAVQELVEEGYASEETAYLAAPVATKLQKGETPSDQEVGRLARALQGEEEPVQAEPVQETEDILEETARETVQEAQEEVQAATFAAPREVVAEEQNVAPVAAESVLEGGEDILMQAAREMTAPKTQETSKVVKSLGYGQHGTQTFERIVENSDMTVEEAKMRFQSAYEAGLTNTPRERVSLLGGIQEQAYNAGRQDYILTLNRAQDGSQYATIRGKDSGLILTDAARDVEPALVNDLHKVSRALGIKTMFVEHIENGSEDVVTGGYMTDDGVLVIARDAVNPYIEVAKHEITHRLQKLAPKEYTAFRNLAVDYESRDRGYGNTTLVEEMQDFYAENGVHLTTEGAMDEIAANFAERLFTDEKARKAMAEQAAGDKQTRTTMEKFWQTVREFIQKVKRVFKGDKAKMDQAAQEQYGATIAELEEAERLWKEAYRAAAENVKKGQERAVIGGAASIKDQALEFSDLLTQFSLREKDPPKKVGVAYKVFFAKNGELYPPMVANPGGEGTPVGVWLDADIGAAAPPSKTGRAQVKAGGKGTQGGSGSLAFRPGWHLGDLPMATQFNRKNPETGKKDLFPADFVWAECEYAMDVDYQEEAMSYGYTEKGKFRHAYAGLPRLPEDGYYRYRTNPNPDTVPWVITGAMKVKRILTDAETDAILRKAGIEPLKRQGGPIDLEKLGIKAGETAKFSLKDSSGKTLTKEQAEYFKDSKVRDDQGRLLVVYHGSKNSGFNEFRYSEDVQTGTDYGEAYYFTSDREKASGYSYDVAKDERVAEYKAKREELIQKFLRTRSEADRQAALNYRLDGKDLGDLIDDEDYLTQGGEVKEVYLNLTDPLIADAGGRYYYEVYQEYFDQARREGKDGIIVKNVIDNPRGEARAIDTYIAFSRNQMKNVTNKKPTGGNDIRFSMKSPVEQKRDLIALHNLDESKLMKSLDLGGFPMPSVAVTATDIPHTNFGDITLVMNKSTVDPKASKKNVVYSADAWTPTFPRIEYEVNRDAEIALYDKARKAGGKLPDMYANRVSAMASSIEDYLNNEGSEEGVIARFKDEYAIKALYLADKGETVETKTQEIRHEKKTSEMLDAMLELFEEDVETLRKMPLNQLHAKYAEGMKQVLLDHGRTEQQAEMAVAKKGGPIGGFDKYISRIIRYSQEPAYRTETVTDTKAMEQDIDSRVDKKGFEKWLADMFRDLIKDSGVRNEKDTFTPSGKRRTFQQTHYPVTLDNIAKAMAKQNGGDTVNAVGGFYGVKTLRAGTAKRFKSIADMHKLEGRLKNLTQEEAEAVSDALGQRLSDVTQRIYEKMPHKSGNQFIDYDTIGQIMMEVATGGKYTVDTIQSVFGKYSYNLGNQLAGDVRDLLFDVSEMPVHIFEAKPERAVRFDEVLAAVVPDTASTKLRERLDEAGVNVLEYKQDDDADRLAKVNSVEGAKFSLKKGVEDYRADLEAAKKELAEIEATDVLSFKGPESWREYAEFDRKRTNARRKVKRIDAKIRELLTPQIESDDPVDSKAFKTWFGDWSNSKGSKVVDADGRPLVVYHGTGAVIEEFLPEFTGQGVDQYGSGFYFTSKRSTAEGYQTRTLNGQEKPGGMENPNVIPVYLNIRHPIVVNASDRPDLYNFDVTPTMAARIIRKAPNIMDPEESILGDYFEEYWEHGPQRYMITRLANEYDWSLGSLENDIFGNNPTEFRQAVKEVLGYDGVQVNFDSGEKHFVAWFPNQIKHATENSGAFSKKDNRIKYSLKGTTDLAAENAKLREVNQGLREQFKTTKFAKVDKKALDQFTKTLMKDYASGADINEIRQMLDQVYTYIANGETEGTSWTEAQKRAFEAAVAILEDASTLDDEMWKQYSDLRKFLRTTAISISKEYDHDLGGYESIEEFRKANFGRLKITKDGTPVDVVYQELAVRWPEFFDEYTDLNQADQLLAIAGVLDQLQPVEINPYSHNMREAATWLASDILERFFELPQAKPTFADKAQDKLTRQVIKDHKKLERLREQKNERIAQIIEKNREKLKTVQAKEKAKRVEAVAEVKEHYKAKEAKGSETRKARELRAKIMRHAKDLHTKLVNPTDKHHVPEDLRKPVAAMLDAINQESQFVIDEATGKRKKGGEGLPTQRTQAFEEMRKQYQAILDDTAPDEGMIVDPAITAMLERVTAMRDTPLHAMTSQELDDLWQALRVVEHMVNNAGKTLAFAKYERTSEWAQAFVDDTDTRKSWRRRKGKRIGLDLENPYTFFSHFGDAGKDLFRMLRNAQDQQQMMVEELEAKVKEIVTGKQVKAWQKETHEFTTDRGDKLTLTTAHVMEIHELTKRQQARDHLVKGGIVQPQVEGKKITRGTDAILLTEGDLGKIVAVLTDEQVQVADQLQQLTSTLLADYGNEASMKAYGYKKFVGKDYWPIKSAREGVHSKIETGGNNSRSIKNIGLAKNVVPHASNPLDIGGIFKTFAGHAGDMTDYAAWLCPMEDAQRIFNFKFRDEAGQQTGKTIKGLLDTIAGTGAQDYYFNLLEDIQNGLAAKSDTGIGPIINKAIGGARGASVGANLRVIVQQPTAILRAAAVLNPADMVAGLAVGGGWKTALKHSAIAKRKDMGGFDISSPAQMNEILFDDKKGLQRFNEAMMWGAGKADAVTWGRIWNACEIATKRKHKDLEKGSDAFYKEVSRLFSEVVDQSQVVDGVLQRSQIMRSSGDMMKAATAFMGEPIMALNMFSRAYDSLVKETDGKKRSAAIRTFGRTAMVLLVTNAVNAVAQSIVDAWRDDDPEKDYLERLKGQLIGLDGTEESKWDKVKGLTMEGNLGSALNPVLYIPFAKDLISLMEGYDVERADAAVAADIIQSATTLIKSLGDDGKRTIGYAVQDLAKQVGKVFGVSAPNIMRDVWGIVRSVAIETGNFELQYEMEKAIYKMSTSSNTKRFTDLLYRAYKEDKDAFDVIYKDMLEADEFKTVNDEGEETSTAEVIGKKLKKRLMNDLFYLYEHDQGMYKAMYKDLTKRGLLDTGKEGTEDFKPTEDHIASAMETLMKKVEGVDSVDDLDKRFVPPEKQGEYDTMLGSVRGSGLWKDATDKQKDKVEGDVYDIVMETKSGVKVTEKLEGGDEYGVDETDYLLYRLALSMVDQPTESGNMGSYNNAERADAFDKTSFSDKEKAYLWSLDTGSDEVLDALEASVDIDTYMDFKAFYGTAKSDKDENGKTVRNSKKKKITKWLSENNVKGKTYSFLYHEVAGYKK